MDELQLREGEPLKLKRGQKIVPLLSVDVPIEIIDTSDGDEAKQKTYMMKYVCPAGCKNPRGGVLTARMTDTNGEVGINCGRCGERMLRDG